METTFIPGPVLILKRAWAFYLAHWTSIVSLVIISFLFPFVIGLVVAGSVVFSHSIVLSVVLGLSLGLAMLVLVFVVQLGLMSYILADGELTVGAALRKGFKLFLPFVWLLIISIFVAFGSYALLIVPGVIMAGYLLFSSLVLIDGGETRGLNALVKSWLIVKDHWWGVLGRMLFLLLIFAAVGIVLGIIGALIGGKGSTVASLISNLVSSLVLSPLAVIYLVMVYRDLKTAKGDLDLTAPAAQNKRKWLIAFLVIGLIVMVLGLVFAGAALLMLKSQLLLQLSQPQPPSLPNLSPQNNLVFGPAGIGFLTLTSFFK